MKEIPSTGSKLLTSTPMLQSWQELMSNISNPEIKEKILFDTKTYNIRQDDIVNVNRDFGEGNKIKAYSTTDISGNYKYKGGLGIQAGIKNVFAKKYYEFQSGNSYKPAAERTYFLGVNYEF